MTATVDLLVVGGGINGVGVAADGAGRGLKVVLCEQNDLASATSSASSKLIHGGLRYLEHYEFRLVRESLRERLVILNKAPHLVRPLRFIMPYQNIQRPAWMLSAGLFLYDHLGVRDERLPSSRAENMTKGDIGGVLRPDISKGFSYYDCRTDDSRLVVINACAAAAHGAEILTRTRLISAERENGMWVALLEDTESKSIRTITAKAIVNAAGPWVADVIGASQKTGVKTKVRLVKGSHIVVPRIYNGPDAFILQNDDSRIIFVIPFQDDFSLIGTTDIHIDNIAAPGSQEIEITDEETEYLCKAVNKYFLNPIKPEDVVWAFAGVRPLLDDGSSDATAVTRNYILDLQTGDGGAPMLSIFGGKLTTYRKLAEKVLSKLSVFFPNMGEPWTGQSPLPGGNIPNGDEKDGLSDLLDRLCSSYPKLPKALLSQLVDRHGTITWNIIDDACEIKNLGQLFMPWLTEREIDYMIDNEWARTADDILWRRTKLGLKADSVIREEIEKYMKRRITHNLKVVGSNPTPETTNI